MAYTTIVKTVYERAGQRRKVYILDTFSKLDYIQPSTFLSLHGNL